MIPDPEAVLHALGAEGCQTLSCSLSGVFIILALTAGTIGTLYYILRAFSQASEYR